MEKRIRKLLNDRVAAPAPQVSVLNRKLQVRQWAGRRALQQQHRVGYRAMEEKTPEKKRKERKKAIKHGAFDSEAKGNTDPWWTEEALQPDDKHDMM